MTPQEKELLTTLLDRLKNAPTQAKDPEAATALVKFLASEAAVSVIKQKGMNPG